MNEDTGIEVLAFCWLGIMIHDSVFGSPCWDFYSSVGPVVFLFQIMVSQGKKKLGEMRHNKKCGTETSINQIICVQQTCG